MSCRCLCWSDTWHVTRVPKATKLPVSSGRHCTHTPQPELNVLGHQHLWRKAPHSLALRLFTARCPRVLFTKKKKKCLFLVLRTWSLYTSNPNTASPGKEGTSQGTWSRWLCPRAVGMAAAWHRHTAAPARKKGWEKPPGCTRVRSPRWSRRWCPCRPSGTQTGTRSSGWRLPTWRTRCSCWAPACCKESKWKEIRESHWDLSSGGSCFPSQHQQKQNGVFDKTGFKPF